MTRRPTPAHHRGTYQATAAKVVAAAWDDPNQTCWRCGLRLDQHAPHKNGRPAFWTAGHIYSGLVEGPLAAESSTCNFQAGGRRKAELDRRRANPRSEEI